MCDFMKEAVALSYQGQQAGLGGPFGAIVVKDGVIVGRGHNQVTSTNDPTAHAEVTAIRDACQNLGTYQLTGCEIYTSCEPCPMCLGAIFWARPDRVYYACTHADASDAGFDDSFIYQQVTLAPAQRSIPMIHQPIEGAKEAFEKWKSNQGKIPY
ncbi:MAG: nucleoside deaminase [Siphonobacter sp.]